MLTKLTPLINFIRNLTFLCLHDIKILKTAIEQTKSLTLIRLQFGH